MRPFRTLHGRLTLAYASALFAGLALFASVSALFLIRLSTNVVDTRLRTTASALTAIAENAGPALALSSNERLEFNKVVRQDDAILFRPDGTTVITTAVSIPTEVVAFDKLGDTEMLIRQVRTPDDVIRAAVTPVYDGTRRIGTIVVWASAASLEAFWRDTILVFVVGIPAIVALAVLMAWFLTRRGLLPLRAITELAADIEAHDLSRRLRPVSEVDELGSLSATFDRMLDRLEGAFDRQRRFTADASHELRAPLSVIQAEADLALRRERSPDEYRDALETIAGEAGHIEELVSELLALARAEADRAPSVGPVNLTPLVVDAAHRLEPLARARDVTIATDVCSNAYLMGDPVDLAHLPVALLHNAVKYARDGGRVVLTLDAPNGAIRLRVRDDGSGFSAEGLQRATERFWRQDGVRGRSGSGLGLAIVRAMVERFGGTIALRNADAGGAEVVVEFPAATPV